MKLDKTFIGEIVISSGCNVALSIAAPDIAKH